MEQPNIEGKVVNLGGQNYIITYWNIDKSLEIFAWLTKNFGQNILSLFMDGGDVNDYLPEVQLDEQGSATNESMVALSNFVGEIFEKLEPKDYVAYVKYIVGDVKMGSVYINPDKMFRGKMVLLHTLVFEVLKYQYSDFLGDESSDQ